MQNHSNLQTKANILVKAQQRNKNKRKPTEHYRMNSNESTLSMPGTTPSRPTWPISFGTRWYEQLVLRNIVPNELPPPRPTSQQQDLFLKAYMHETHPQLSQGLSFKDDRKWSDFLAQL
jgi:hypothetical protein